MSNWSKPRDLPNLLPKVPSFSYKLIPKGLREWIKDVAERMQAAPEMIAVAAIAAVAYLVARKKIAIRPKGKDDWTEVPNLWGMIIARSGFLKTPALSAALRPIEALVKQATGAFREALETFKAEKAARKVELQGHTEAYKKAISSVTFFL